MEKESEPSRIIRKQAYKSVPSFEVNNPEHSAVKNPLENAGFLSIISFAWLWKTVFLGYRRDLIESDLFTPLNDHRSDFLGEKIENLWFEEVQCKAKIKGRPSLLKVLIKCFGKEMSILGFFIGSSTIFLRICEPLFLGKILSYFKRKSEMTLHESTYWVGALVLLSLSQCLVCCCFYSMQILGMKIRIACSCLVYSKVLKLSRISFESKTTSGQVLNLLSNDVMNFDYAFTYIHYIWISFILIPIVAYMTYQEIGWSALAGIIIFILMIFLQGKLGKLMPPLSLEAASQTDERLRLTNEIVKGAQMIKMLSWEEPFFRFVNEARKKEMRANWKVNFIELIAGSFQLYSAQIALFFATASYVMLNNSITAEKLFVVAVYYYSLRLIINNILPLSIQFGAKAYASVKRLEKFLTHDEILYPTIDIDRNIDNLKTIDNNKECNISHSEELIFLQNARAKWSSASKEDCIKSLHFSAKRGNITAIIGQVASGKSSLLNLILHELPLLSGKIKIHGEISYFSQEPWTFGSSIRTNILFGRPMDKRRYDQVIKVCQLERDFSILPYKDQTIIGEKGINLSGGQRARVALARTVYADVDIYLLDDPLSALDAEVGRLVFEECICNFLKGKTRILVTHQLQYLKNVDYVYVLNDGSVQHEGTFQDLQNPELDIVRVLQIDDVEENNIDQLCKDSYSGNITNSENFTSEKKEKEADEGKAVGKVSSQVYLSYFKAVGNNWVVFLACFLGLIKQVTITGADYLMSFWVNNKEVCWVNVTSISGEQCLTVEEENKWFFYVYGGLILSVIILAYLQIFFLLQMFTRASRGLHKSMVQSINHATMIFFYQNPVGRIMNRFSKEMGIVDKFLPTFTNRFLQNMFLTLVMTIMTIIVNYWLLFPILFNTILTALLAHGYLKISRSVQRLDGITRSKVIRHVEYTLQGLSTIRAFQAQNYLFKEFNQHQDRNCSAWFIYVSSFHFLFYYMELIFSLYTAFLLYTFLFIGDENSVGKVGFLITQNIILAVSIKISTFSFADLENCMISVERILEYTRIDQEKLTKNNSEDPLLDKWPEKGQVIFKDVYLKYSPKGNPVLKNLNFVVRPEEKIGIVGRTGAGKTSLISALFRLVKLEGEIYIDDIPTSTLGLGKLRSKISIIPQEPLLFAGTLRKNLDPFEKYSDDDLWQALEEVKFKKTMIKDLDAGLESKISDGGLNLSKGQRQLLCLARATVRINKILVLDEPTADVDEETDQIIQTTIRKKFEKCTIFIVAHRLITVIDCDRIMVMNEGSIVEFDSPFLLLENKKGFLYDMVQQTGPEMAGVLTQIAESNYLNRKKD